ncbi:MAG: hypothetical protein WEA10_09925 [Actinomycetota bacterium]
MSGSAGVMAVVLAQTVAGSAALLWATPLWGEVKRGFFTLTGSILFVLAILTWFTASSGRIPGDEAGDWIVRLAAANTIVTLLWLVLLIARKHAPARLVGILGAAVAIGVLIPIAIAARQGAAVAMFQLLAGAWFLGAVVDGLLLGHWYLTDRGLTRVPINRYTNVLIGGVVAEGLAVLAAFLTGGFEDVSASATPFNPLTVQLAGWIALGMVGATALVAIFVRLTLKGERASAVQAATGFFYLAVMTAFIAEVAVKTQYLPR